MKRFLQDPIPLPRAFIMFLALVTLVSAIGGYQLSRLIYRMIDFPMQRAQQLLIIEKNLDDAAIVLGMQIQEWKDMLLRADNEELFNKHRKAFLDASVDVQFALQRTRVSMQNIGLDTGGIDQLGIEHKSLVSSYVLALAKLDARQAESMHAVDKLVIGVDRKLQQHITKVKTGIEQLAQQQLSGALPGEENHYWLVGVVGAVSLLVMALVGFIFALRFMGHEGKVEKI